MNINTTYYANGKLLLSGEYLVLKGAEALALPLTRGQQLTISPNNKGLQWSAFSPDGLWFHATFSKEMALINTNNKEKGKRLEGILQKAIQLKPDIITVLNQSSVKTTLGFKPEWGWGSSSTLISLLSQWLNINPYSLLNVTFGGSGYDIACATQQSPLIYQMVNNHTEIKEVDFAPPFSEHIHFVYSGKKQNSQNEVKRFSGHIKISPSTLETCNQITNAMIHTKDMVQFGKLIEEHETLISSVIDKQAIKSEYFSDFMGYIKSLGAWGGDFIMAISPNDETYITNYFNTKGLNTIVKYDDIVLNTNH